MKSIGGGLYVRGVQRTLYLRRRIPRYLRRAYPPGKTDYIACLKTTDVREGRKRLIFELAQMEAEFEQKRVELDLQRVSTRAQRVRALSDTQLESVARFWSHQVLTHDEQRRPELDDEAFDELGVQLIEQRAQLSRMQARGRTEGILPALKSFLFLCGLEFDPVQDESRRAARIFLQGALKTLDVQIRRHSGEIVPTDEVAPPSVHPLYAVVPELMPRSQSPWEQFLTTWGELQIGRPVSTVIAYRTAWNDLERVAGEQGVSTPQDVTPAVVAEFVKQMRSRRLAASTAKARLAKIRYLYRIALGVSPPLARLNPAEHTLGYSDHRLIKQARKRLPLDDDDLARLFGGSIYTHHLRSQGQAGESCYWIPLIMFYTGARPEEVAGLALCDLLHHPMLGWYFDIIDRAPPGLESKVRKATADDEDDGLFDDLPEEDEDDESENLPEDYEIPLGHRRLLKNGASARKVPLAQPLIDLGLLRYVEWLRGQGATVLFPTLKKDSHDKLSGAFGKFFTRYKRGVGINDERKVLYSLRHCMKDFLQDANIPSKYLKRILGHRNGDGEITEGYGSDVPFSRIVRYFKRVEFPKIAAQPWEPRRGVWSKKKKGGL